MRIPGFSSIIKENSTHHVLKGGCVVIDARNFFYDCYHDSKLPVEFGADCDRYAKYLKEYLGMFKRANITCYFIFRGSKDHGKKTEEQRNEYNLHKNTNELKPISLTCSFTTDIHLEIMKKMKFNFLILESDSKYVCITLARKLSCPVISDDIEFPLSGVQYIYKDSLTPIDNKIYCKLFSLDTFLYKNRLDKDDLSLFILLSDQNLFPLNSFDRFFQSIEVPLEPMRRNKVLLRRLSEQSVKLQKVFNQLNWRTKVDKEQISIKFCEVKKMVNGEINSQMASDYFFSNPVTTDWLVKGVATNHIAQSYALLYRSNVLFRIRNDLIDVTTPPLKIIKYAYDLLTEFKYDGLKCICFSRRDGSKHESVIPTTINKPTYESVEAIFQNGGESRGLFQHFISETIHFDCDKLQNVPNDAKILMITLVYVFYFKLYSNTKITNEMAYAVLLSYVMLGVVQEYVDEARSDNSITKTDSESAFQLLQDYFDIKDSKSDSESAFQFLLDYFDIKDSKSDSKSAFLFLQDYFDIKDSKSDSKSAFQLLQDYFNIKDSKPDSEKLYQLVQEWFNLKRLEKSLANFQGCLSEMNNLNKLCGSPFEPTIYSKTYNGTFIYRIIDTMQHKGIIVSITELLSSSAPTVLAYFLNIVKLYNNLIQLD